MTLYSKPNCDLHPSGCIEMRNDAFAWQGSGEEYWFLGVTLANGKWKPNSLSWDQYYIMTGNQGIAISYTYPEFNVALVEEGKEVLIARVGETEIAQAHSSFKPTKHMSLGTRCMHVSFWHYLKTMLEVTQSSESAQILSAMKAWEKTSYLTLLQAENALRNQREPPDTKEMFVAGQHWLWHNITKGVVIIGCKKKVWGSAHLHSGEKVLDDVVLLPSGNWLVSTDSHEKYLVHWNGRDVEARAFAFPHGPWHDHGEWRYWYEKKVILTPEKRLAMAPRRFRFEHAYPNWACFRDCGSKEHVLLINRRGKSLILDLSEYTYGGGKERAPEFCPGEQHMLFFHLDNHRRGCFSLVNISPVENVERKPRPLWQVVADPHGLMGVDFYPVYLKDEDEAVEVFAFIVYPRRHAGDCEICLINERGEFWMPPFYLEDVFRDYYDILLGYYASTDRATWYDKPAIAVYARYPNQKNQKFALAVIRVSNGQGHMQLRSGITLSGPFIPIPKGEEGLWPYLASALNLERIPKEE